MIIKENFDVDSYNEEIDEILIKIGDLYECCSKYLEKEKLDHLNEAIGELLKAEIEDYEIEGDEE